MYEFIKPRCVFKQMFECVRALTRGCEFDVRVSVVSCLSFIATREWTLQE